MTPQLKTLAPVVCALLAGACHITPAPDAGDAIGTTARVFAPVMDERVGDLFLQPDGLWAFVGEDRGKRPRLEEGQVVAFGDLERTSRHLFAVVRTHGWGAELQRLDVDPVAPHDSGSLIPLSSLDIQTARRWAFCTGSGASDLPDCLTDAPVGTRWHFYPVEDANRFRAAESRHGMLPFRRNALGVVEPDGLSWIVGEPSGGTRWLAVPTRQLPLPSESRAAVDPACPSFTPADSMELVRDSAADVNHPLGVESEAYRYAVDALIWCEGSEATLAVPAIYRPPVKMQDGFSIGPPLLGTRRHTLDTKDPRLLASWLHFAGAVATGDWTTADFELERLARLADGGDLDATMLDAMYVALGAGRPEAALRLGRGGTRQDWNRDTSPRFLLGMAAIERSLGLQREYIIRMGTVADAVSRSDDKSLRGWLTWLDARERLHRPDQPTLSADIGSLVEKLEAKGFEDWRLLLRFEEARVKRDDDAMKGMQEKMSAAGATSLLEGARGVGVQLACEGECRLDSYGRHLHAKLDEETVAAPFHRVPRLVYRPGFASEPILKRAKKLDDATAAMGIALAAYPLVPPADRADLVEFVVRQARSFVGGRGCAEDADGLRDLERVARLALLPLRVPESSGGRALDWLARVGLEAACDGPETLARRGARFANDTSSHAWMVARLFEAILQQASKGKEAHARLDRAAQFAARYERGVLCKRWNLALAAAYADAGHLDEGEEFAATSASCEADAPELVQLESVIMAFVNYEKTLAVSRDFGRKVRHEVFRIVKQAPAEDPTLTCVGLQHLEYGLVEYLPERIRLLARSVPLERRELGELDIITARHNLSNALSDLETMRDALEKKDVSRAAKHLVRARDIFRRLGHRTGVARTDFYADVVFEGKVEAYVPPEPSNEKKSDSGDEDAAPDPDPDDEDGGALDWEAPKPTGWAEKLQSGDLTSVTDDADAPRHVRLAAALLSRGLEGAVQLYRASPEGSADRANDLDVLCKSELDATRPTPDDPN